MGNVTAMRVTGLPAYLTCKAASAAVAFSILVYFLLVYWPQKGLPFSRTRGFRPCCNPCCSDPLWPIPDCPNFSSWRLEARDE